MVEIIATLSTYIKSPQPLSFFPHWARTGNAPMTAARTFFSG
jgi:hypothetical protein